MFLLRADKPIRYNADDATVPAEFMQDAPASDDDAVLCRQCHQVVTRQRFKTAVNGSYQHTFANPNGVVFEIGCFQAAEGVLHAGQPTTEWSWFAGYQWRMAACSNCRQHLGWLFIAVDQTRPLFYGFILDCLQEQGDGG